MFEVDLVDSCGDMLSLSLEEALGSGKVAVIGPAARKMHFLGWKPDYFVDPMGFSGDKKYDIIVCLQCLSSLQSIELINVDNEIYGANGHELIVLNDRQLQQASAFMKQAGINLSRGESAVLPLELHSFLAKIEKSLSSRGTALFIDYGNSSIFKKLTPMESKYSPLSRFLASTKAGKLHVVNFNPYLAKSPHPIRDSPLMAISSRLKCKNKAVPWLDIKDKLPEGDKALLEPFIIRLSQIFSGWGEVVKDYKIAANELKRQLKDEDGITQAYATSFILGMALPPDFSKKAWTRAAKIASLPEVPPLFAVKLQKIYK